MKFRCHGVHSVSQLPLDSCKDPPEDIDVTDSPLWLNCWLNGKVVCNTTLTISIDQLFFDCVHKGYKHDDFCKKNCPPLSPAYLAFVLRMDCGI
jgi:hypothetical protein